MADVVPNDAVDNIDIALIRAVQASTVSHTGRAGNPVVSYSTIGD